MLRVLLLSAMALFASPPSGRVPIGPLERYDPKAYDVGFEVSLLANWRDSTPGVITHEEMYARGSFDLNDVPIVFPIIFRGAYSKVDPNSLGARFWCSSSEDTSFQQRTRLDAGKPFNVQLAVMNIASCKSETLRWRIQFRSQSWSSRIDEVEAQRLAWPTEWPEDVRDGLKSQMFIESDAPIFAEFVQRISQGQLRTVPPYLAAKDLIRACINELAVSGDGERRKQNQTFHGMEIAGALQAATTGKGGPHDLVCVCVAVLRAAGIPARPVIGLTERADGRNRLRSWAEFYLEGAGWIPFDPYEMRGKGIAKMKVQQPWPEFGSLKNLNRFIPLAYHFHPPVDVICPEAPAVWGWDPRRGMPQGTNQVITLTLVSRGAGEDDPK